jgi:MGT family glycosyltransferase
MMDERAMGAARFLFALFDGGGNVEPQLTVAQELAARGHRVRILASGGLGDEPPSPALVRAIERAGCAVAEWRTNLRPVRLDPRARGLLLGRSTRFFGSLASTNLLYYGAPEWAENVLAALGDEPADVLAADHMLPGALTAGERAGLPTAALLHSIHFFRPAPGVPPTGTGLFPMGGPIGRVRDALVAAGVRRLYWRDATPKLNAIRDHLGLERLRYPFEEYDRAHRVLVMTSTAFDLVPSRLPTNVRYTGMPFPRTDDGRPWSPPWSSDDRRPLVLVSYSSNKQGQDAVIGRLIAALGQLDVRALVTLGRSMSDARYVPASNVWLTDWAPHERVLPHASLVVTHGGHGTVLKALRHGVPVLVTPMCCDQFDVAVRVALRGVGERLSADSSAAALGSGVLRVLGSPKYRAAAQRLALRLAGEDGASAAADALETLTANTQAGRPQPGPSAVMPKPMVATG